MGNSSKGVDKGQHVKKYNADKTINQDWLKIHQPWKIKDENPGNGFWVCGGTVPDASDFDDFDDDSF